MKTNFTFKLANIEVKQGDKSFTIGEGTVIETSVEYAVEEVIEQIKNLPQIISTVKEAVNEVVKSAAEFGKTEAAERRETAKLNAEIAATERQQQTDLRIKEADAEAAREVRVRRTDG